MTDTVLAYDVRADAWRTVPHSLTSPRARAAAAGAGGKLYLLGGMEGDVVSSRAERYDPQDGAWRPLPSMTFARADLTAVVADGVLFVIGVTGVDGKTVQVIERFDPALETWSSLAVIPDMGAPSLPINGASLGGRLFVRGYAEGIPHLFGYSLASRLWFRLGAIPVEGGGYDYLAALESTGHLYGLGGEQLQDSSYLEQLGVRAYPPAVP
jgi:hypothetical protein